MRIGVVVVVKLLAAKPDRDRRNVSALVLDVEIPVTNSVTNTVYDSSCPEGNPHHLHAPDERADEKAEQVDVDAKHDWNAKPVERGKEMPLQPVVGSAFAVFV